MGLGLLHLHLSWDSGRKGSDYPRHAFLAVSAEGTKAQAKPRKHIKVSARFTSTNILLAKTGCMAKSHLSEMGQ